MRKRQIQQEMYANRARGLWRRNILAVLVFGLVTACGASQQEDGAVAPMDVSASTEPNAETIHVRVVRVVREELTRTVTATGTIAPRRTTNVGALVDGVIEEIFVNVGDHVAQGDPLFRTRVIDYQNRAAEAEATHQLALAQAQQTRRELDRARTLEERNIAPPRRREDAETELRVAQARVAQASAALDEAHQRLSDTTVTAPFAGAVIDRAVDEGAYMSSSFSGLGSSSIIRIAECAIGVAVARFPETDLAFLSEGQSSRLYVEGRQDPIVAQIRVLNDALDVATRTGELRVPFENPECTVRAGQFVRVEVDVMIGPLLLVPQSAIIARGGAQRAFVVEDGRALERTVRARPAPGLRMRIDAGLDEGELVIVSPPDALEDGSLVEQRAS